MDSAPIEQVIPGAQLVVRYAIYRHSRIYAGGGCVIHYAGWIRGRRGFIQEVPLDEFTEGREFEVKESPPDLIHGRDIVRRARSRLGERCYDLLENNCEHFLHVVSVRGGAVAGASAVAFAEDWMISHRRIQLINGYGR